VFVNYWDKTTSYAPWLQRIVLYRHSHHGSIDRRGFFAGRYHASHLNGFGAGYVEYRGQFLPQGRVVFRFRMRTTPVKGGFDSGWITGRGRPGAGVCNETTGFGGP
jgi:hypothetical protein